jgi:hypothetical protein
MPTENGDHSTELRRLFPWSEIFRAFQVALDPSKLFLAAAAIFLLWLGWSLLGLVFGEQASYGTWPGNVNRGKNPFQVVSILSDDLFTKKFWLGGDGQEPPIQLEVFRNFFGPVMALIKSTPREGKWWGSLFGLLYTLAVWGIFGGAITRIAAVQLARREKIGMMDALRYAQKKFTSYFSAPLIPLGGVAFLAILLVIGSLLLHIPLFGDLLVGLVFFLPLIAGFIMALLIIGFIGWPLMYATISAEGTDSFDALSRCYAYVYQKPWHYVLYSLLALVYGVLVVFFMIFIASFAVLLIRWGMELIPWFGWRGEPINSLFVYAPVSYDWRAMLTERSTDDALKALVEQMAWYQKLAAGLVGFWLNAIFLFVMGFAYSFFWVVGTAIYFLLRKVTDDTDLDEVYLEEEEEMMPFAPPPAEAPTLPMTSPTAPEREAVDGGDATPRDESSGPPPEAN